MSGIVLGLMVSVFLGRQAAPVQAAGGLVVYVDDGPGNNGSVKCPNAFSTIKDAVGQINASGITNNVTLNICPGTYTAFVTDNYQFLGHTNLKIIGLGNPRVAAGNYSGAVLFDIQFSTNVTVQGLTIDGQSSLTITSVAIRFASTSGTIKGNTISGWHQKYTGAVPFTPSSAEFGIVVQTIFSDQTVAIQNNAVYDPQDVGILIAGSAGKIKISGNRVVLGSGVLPVYKPGGSVVAQAGIGLVDTDPGASVTGNQVISDADLYPENIYTRGIMLYETSGAKVTGNTVRGTTGQITIENYCDNPGAPSNSNLISGNKLYDTISAGVYITARTDHNTNCGTPHADLNKVTGNIIYTYSFTNPFGVFGVALETEHGVSDAGGAIGGTVVTGNTIAGFTNTITILGPQGQVAGLVSSPNKILASPPAGVFK